MNGNFVSRDHRNGGSRRQPCNGDRQGRPLRVLYMIDNAGAPGGAERFVTGLAHHVPRERIEPWVCSTRRGDESAVRALKAAGIPHIELGRTSMWHVHRLKALIALLRVGRFDVLHAHKFGSNIWGTLIGRACRVPVVLAHEHTWSYSGDRVRKWLDGHVIGRLATRFLAVSASDRARMIGLEGISEDKVVVMPVSRIPQEQPTAGDLRRELGLSSRTPLIGVVAQMRRQKALDVMLDAQAELLTRIPEAHLVIAGDGACRPELERQIERLGISERVHLLGVRRDIDRILAAVDVAAMSSDWEGVPLFLLECMAAEVPVVATAVGGIPEIIVDGETGLLVPPRDPSALARALERILTDRQLAHRLATSYAARTEEFAIDTVARRFADLYEELVAEAETA
jgi:glycosyltransferase involved in cell wall biosynthesis